MAVQKFGVDNLKLLIKFPLGLTKELTQDFADGKLQFMEQLGLINQIMQGVSIAKVWPKIKEELAELSTAEKKDIRAFVVSEFNLTDVSNNKAIDALVKSSLAFAVSGWELIEGWKSINQST